MQRITARIIQSLVPILIGSGVLAINLHAQEDSAVIVNIPFPFTVGTQNVAPGTYQFNLISSQFILSVRNVKTGDKEMFDVRPEQQSTLEQHGRVVFRKSAGRSVLNEVHFPDADTFSELIPRRRIENIEAKKSAPADAVSVARR